MVKKCQFNCYCPFALCWQMALRAWQLQITYYFTSRVCLLFTVRIQMSKNCTDHEDTPHWKSKSQVQSCGKKMNQGVTPANWHYWNGSGSHEKASRLKVAAKLKKSTKYATVRENNTRRSITLHVVRHYFKIQPQLNALGELLQLLPTSVEVVSWASSH